MRQYLKCLRPNTNADKVLAAAGYGSVFVALIVIARTSPATGYELSIYYAYPAYLWFLFVASSACGIGILIHQAFAEKSRWWLAGLLLVIFSNSVFLGLSFFRGYGLFSGGDAMTHVGMMKDIMATGYIGAGNFYPLIHVLGVSLRDITGISYAAVTNLLFVFFTMMYLLNAYLLATIVASRRGQALLITAFACPLVFSYLHALIHPSVLSIFMLPLLLYFYHRRQSFPVEGAATVLPLILLTLLIGLFHPVTAIFAIIALLALNLSGVIYRQITKLKKLAPRGSRSTAWDYVAPLTGVIVFLIWLLPHPTILYRLRQVWRALASGSGITPISRVGDALVGADITTSQAVELFIARYGAIFIYGLIAAIAALIVFRMILSRRACPRPMHLSYAVLFAVGVAASVVSLFGFTHEYEPERISRFFLIATPVVSGLMLYDLVSRRHRQPFNLGRLKPGSKRIMGIVTVLILAASVLSTFSVYNSPRVVRRNAQVSHMEIAGTAWFISHYDRSTVTAMRWPAHFRRFEDFSFGLESHPYGRVRVDLDPIPSHFGYDQSTSVAESYEFEDRYLLTCKAARSFPFVIPKNIRYMVPHYEAEDFARMRADSTVSQIYANREFEVWRVYG